MKRMWSSEDGASSVEYSLLIIGIAFVVIAVAQLLGTTVSQKFADVEKAFDDAGS